MSSSFQTGEVIERPRVRDGWSYGKALSHQFWWAPPSATMVRKRVFDEIGGFDTQQQYSEDTDLWRRISWRHTIHQMDEVLMRYRQGHLSGPDLAAGLAYHEVCQII